MARLRGRFREPPTPLVSAPQEKHSAKFLPQKKQFMAQSAKPRFWDLFFTKNYDQSIVADTLWSKKDNLWIAFLSREMPSETAKDLLFNYLVDREFIIIENKTSKFIADDKSRKRHLSVSIGRNDREEKMLHCKCQDDDDPKLEFWEKLLLDFAETMAENAMLRSQRFDQAKLEIYINKIKAAKKGKPIIEESKVKVVNDALVFKEDEGICCIFLNNELRRENLKDLLIDYAGSQGLACKMDGKATVKAAR
jgi:hypothetical protein